MCLTMPGQVLSVEGGSAVVDLDGRRQLASTVLHPGVGAGDWVMVAVGTIVDRLSAREADEIQAALRTTAFAGSRPPTETSRQPTGRSRPKGADDEQDH